MTKLEWSEIDTYLSKSHMNLRWITEAVRTEDFNVDSLSKCQLVSKFRLIELLQFNAGTLGDIVIAGGWYGQLATMLSDADLGASYTGVDFDRSIQAIAERLNRHIDYTHVVGDMYEFGYDGYDTVINTSCEHIADLREWLDLLPKGTKVVLQSNNYFELEEHINCSATLNEFIDKADLSEVIMLDEIEMPIYTRYTIVGRT